MPKEIPLVGKKGQGLVALVDDDDYAYLSQFRWRNAHGYAVRTVTIASGKSRNLGMHTEIMKPPPGYQVDHHDLHPLNNTRENLRIATSGQNNANQQPDKSNSSGFKGVSWLERNQRWIVWICVDGKNRYVGAFTNLLEAARAYNEAAKFFYGKFAWLNDVPDSTPCRITTDILQRKFDRENIFYLTNTSGKVGVHWHKIVGKWNAAISSGGRRIHIVYSEDPDEAAYVYDQVALQLHGEKAKLNILTGPSIPWPSQTVDAA